MGYFEVCHLAGGPKDNQEKRVTVSCGHKHPTREEAVECLQTAPVRRVKRKNLFVVEVSNAV